VLEHYRSDDGRRFLSRQAVWLAVCAAALLALFAEGRLDLAIQYWFFDDARKIFPLVNHWLLKTVLHDAARTASAVAAVGLLALALASYVLRQPAPLHAHRRELLFAAVTALASAGVVAVLKHSSTHACPSDLALFGGTAAYHPLLGAPATVVRGCSPAAHPLTGYAWLGVGFALYPTARRAAMLWWRWTITLGTLFGLVQVIRGAHFLSHVLWSVWVVWAVDLTLLAACALARDPSSPRAIKGRPGP
jgi:membrane-associated PAP2 superfamily phosphatase